MNLSIFRTLTEQKILPLWPQNKVHLHTMLSRRFLRVKVLQGIYAYQQDGFDSLQAGEKQLMVSLDKLYELYVYLLSLIVEVSDFSQRRIDENRQKLLPSQDDLNPNLRFVQNRFVKQLTENRDFQRRVNLYKINWGEEIDLIRRFYNAMREDSNYQGYMSKSICSYADDKTVVSNVVLRILSESDLLRSYLAEKSIYWTEDFDTAVMMVDKTIKGYKVSYDEFTELPTLLKDEKDPQGSEDLQFLKVLYRKTIMKSEDYDEVIRSKAANWELERIALMDTILIKMAITELVEFPSIPVKVTLNEFIELAKEYSSAKSKLFINGLLDNLISDYKEQNIIKKSGRGLME